MKKPWILCLSLLLSLGALLKVYDKLVDGFYLYRTTPPKKVQLPFNTQPSQDLTHLESIFHQPFYYLASGSQSFVFISSDHQFILKLFKHHRWKPSMYTSWIHTKNWTQKRLNGLLATYQSCLFCIQEFPKETALLYLQLQPSDRLSPTLTLHNRLGKKYTLSLADTSFILQKYAEPVPSYLLTLKASGHHEEAKECIHKLFSLLLQKRSKGFTDKDPNFLNNFGFVGNEAVSIDVGGLIKDPKKDNVYFCNQELKKVSRTLLPWLKNHYPELLPYTQELIQTTKEQLTTSIKDHD